MLNEAQLDKVIKFIEAYPKIKQCQICGDNNVGISDMYAVSVVEDGIDKGRKRVFIPVECSSCGHMMLFQAKKVGITDL